MTLKEDTERMRNRVNDLATYSTSLCKSMVEPGLTWATNEKNAISKKFASIGFGGVLKGMASPDGSIFWKYIAYKRSEKKDAYKFP